MQLKCRFVNQLIKNKLAWYAFAIYTIAFVSWKGYCQYFNYKNMSNFMKRKTHSPLTKVELFLTDTSGTTISTIVNCH